MKPAVVMLTPKSSRICGQQRGQDVGGGDEQEDRHRQQQRVARDGRRGRLVGKVRHGELARDVGAPRPAPSRSVGFGGDLRDDGRDVRDPQSLGGQDELASRADRAEDELADLAGVEPSGGAIGRDLGQNRLVQRCVRAVSSTSRVAQDRLGWRPRPGVADLLDEVGARQERGVDARPRSWWSPRT